MKNIRLYIFIIAAFLLACGENKKTEPVKEESKPVTKQEVVSEQMDNDYLKAQLLEKGTSYFLTSSPLTCDFTQSKRTGKISVTIHFDKAHTTTVYERELECLHLILPEAAKEYLFDSLYLVSIGRLFNTGSLAADISNQYKEKFGDKDITNDYKAIGEFLAGSKLGTDINALVEPYGLVVEGVSVEKVFFASKEDFLKSNILSVAKTNIPEKILDCITWVKLKKK